jgi:hypothetical protein
MSSVPNIAIEVTGSEYALKSRRTYHLPVTIGRGSGCDIQLEADNRAISRVHVEIVEERGRSYAYNRASNLEATQFRGRSLTPNERVEVVPGDVLTIFGTEIRVLESAKLGIMIARRSDLKPLGEHHLLPGSALLAYEIAEILTVEPVADLAKLETGHLANRLAVLFYYDGPEPTFAVVSNPDNLPVLVDRALIDQPAIYIHAEDTIEVGTHRYEVMTVGEASIVCENPGCQVLNAYDRGENCRVCGTRLFGATRLLRVRKL